MRPAVCLVFLCMLFLACPNFSGAHVSIHEATTNPSAAPSPSTPDPGQVSGRVYQNDFFGFTYTFPDGWKLIGDKNAGQNPSDVNRGTLIIGTPGYPPDITAVAISFDQIPDASGLTPREYITDQRSRPPQNQLKLQGDVVDYSWGGQPFVRQVYSGKIGRGQMWQVDSVIFVKGYLLQVRLMTNTKKRYEDFVSNPKALSFSVPTKTSTIR